MISQLSKSRIKLKTDDTDYTDDDIRELFSDPQVDAFPPHDDGYRG